jgi:putative transposase
MTIQHPDLSLRQACLLLNLSTFVYYYQSEEKLSDNLLYTRLTQLVERYPTWGFWKLYHKLRQQGVEVNHKRLYRIYKQLRLNLRRRTRKRIAQRVREPLVQPLIPNLYWSMDFMHDGLFTGKSFRTFNVIDDFNREALNITVAHSITSERVIRELEQLISWRGKPERIRVDNGPEFIASALEQWCGHESRRIELVFIRKGKPSENGYIERFNRTFREDILDRHLFVNAEQAQHYAHQWMWMYNNERPHESLNNLTPRDFLRKYGKIHYALFTEEQFPTFLPDINKSNQSSLYLSA